jgi:protein-S-isoprenylcysteine O-methyltransferase Ste14
MSQATLGIALAALWIGWLVYWWTSARDVKVTRWREPLGSQLLHRVPLICVALLFAAPRWVPKVLTRRFLPLGSVFSLVGVLLVAAGLGFAIWARRHLGRNWSAHVAVKEDHALIRTGPYRRLRHPIYTGILLAFLGTALVVGEWRALVAVPFALLAFAIKSRLEERQMRQVFPEYEQYQRETAAIIPFIY